MPEQPTTPQRKTISWEQALQHKQGGDAGVPATVGLAEGVSVEEPLADAEVVTPDPVPQPEVTERIGTPETAISELQHDTSDRGDVATQESEPTLDTLPEDDTQPASVAAVAGGIVSERAIEEINEALNDPSEPNLVALSRAAHQ